MGMSARLAIAIVLVIAALPRIGGAQDLWSGPEEVIVAEFGSGPGQVGLDAGSVAEYDTFPDAILAADDGTLFVPDPVNERMLVRTVDGAISHFGSRDLSVADAAGWPGRQVVPFGTGVLVKSGRSLQLYDRAGALLATAQVDGELLGLAESDRCVVRRAGSPAAFDLLDGRLERRTTLTGEPPLLGEVAIAVEMRIDPERPEARPLRDLRLRTEGREIVVRDFASDVSSARGGLDGSVYLVHTAIDPDRSYRIEMPEGPASRLPIPNDVVAHVASDGSVANRLDLPPSEFDPVYVLDGFDDATPRRIVGGTVVDRNGNVYAFRRDATHYRVLKWTRR